MNHIEKYPQDLKGKTALVTGGTKGIGKAVADRLSKSGATVIIVARNPSTEMAIGHHFIQVDLTDPGSVSRMKEKIEREFEGIDILINNVGGLTAPVGGHSTLNDEDWNKELQFNLVTATRLDRAFIPSLMRNKDGVIIHMSSVAGKQALWQLNMAYAVSKAALNAYSKALSSELASKGVRVLTVSPGASRTETMEAIISDYANSLGLSYEDGMQQLLRDAGGVPMGRMSEPEEVASLIHFLVSPAAAYLTGANYLIDGGAVPVV